MLEEAANLGLRRAAACENEEDTDLQKVEPEIADQLSKVLKVHEPVGESLHKAQRATNPHTFDTNETMTCFEVLEDEPQVLWFDNPLRESSS